jgi:uncharacterized protein YbjT (DUF2867 family)
MSNRAGLLRRPDMSARIRLLVIGTSGGTAAAVVSKALARGHRVTPHHAAIAHAATLAGHDAIRVIDAARTAGPRRIAVITAGATPAEALLADSGLDWTVARAARLTDGGLSVRYRLAAGRLPPRPRPVSRRDVAHFLLHELERPAYLRAIVGVAR